ncbi:TSUP family transporter [Candidatus Micrarchaeota archaeon]|nr:TSUP family transporter [Candidatus Micrarchaeota archaeon]
MILESGIFLLGLALVCEYVDSTLGMGYGTTLTPILLIVGFDPLQIVPAVLLSELLTGFFAAFAHHSAGNVDFSRDSLHLKVALLLGACSAFGAVFAVFAALSLPQFYVKLYIGLLVAIMGLAILLKRHFKDSFSWKRIAGLGILAAFNKGISGGGYGPLVVTGQMFSGLNGKNAIGITSLAEGFTCFAGVSLYMLTGSVADWQLAPYLIAGAVLSVPLSALTLKKIQEARLTVFIGIITLLLGLVTIAKNLNLF